MTRLFRRLLRETFMRYLAASGVALGADASAFFALVAAGVPPGSAAALAYCGGILVHWLISSRAVFPDEVAERGAPRNRQKMLFVSSAMVGLALTTAIVSTGAALQANLAATKGVAVAVSFTVGWLIRRWVVFRPRAVAVAAAE